MNVGKILLLLAVLSTAVIIYLNAPPRGTVVFFIILMLLATPFLYYFWTSRMDILKLEGRSKVFAIVAAVVMFVFAVLWYDHEYENLVYFTDDGSEDYLYFPLQENEELSKMIAEGGGSLAEAVDHYGFAFVKEQIALNNTKSDYLVTDAYLILVAILGYLSLFLILLFLYTAVWGNKKV